MSDKFKMGDRILHPSFGKGGIIGIASAAERNSKCAQVQIHFDSGAIKWLALEYARLVLLDERDDPVREEGGIQWPESTFIFETKEVEHYLGAHWEPFFDDAQELFVRLPEIMPTALVQACYGDNRKPIREIPTEWPLGIHLCWPLRVRGLGTTEYIDNENKTLNIVSLYPFWNEGTQARLTIKSVNVWHGGCEAQLTAAWGDAEVSFFDTQFMINRGWYEAGRACEFVLSGIAYSAAPAVHRTTTIKHDAETLAKINALLAQDGKEPIEAERKVIFDGAAIFLPIDEWDVDDYSFHAPITEVREFDDFLGQKGWRVRATVMRAIGLETDDVDLTIVITQRAWGGDKPPYVGQDIEGRIWLQGYMIYH